MHARLDVCEMYLSSFSATYIIRWLYIYSFFFLLLPFIFLYYFKKTVTFITMHQSVSNKNKERSEKESQRQEISRRWIKLNGKKTRRRRRRKKPMHWELIDANHTSCHRIVLFCCFRLTLSNIHSIRTWFAHIIHLCVHVKWKAFIPVELCRSGIFHVYKSNE